MRTLDQERFTKKINRAEGAAIKRELSLQAVIMAVFLAIFWGGYLVNNVLLDGWLSRHLVLQARTLEGLFGAFLTPFMHVNAFHVIGSSILLLFLGWWVMLRDTRDFFLVHFAALLGSGAMVWLFESGNIHWHGWGGIAFGMAGYLLTAGLFERRWATMLSSLVAMFVIGGWVATSIFVPGSVGSWYGVMGGLLGGVATSAFLGWRRRDEEDPEDLIGDRVPSASELASGSGDVELDFGVEEFDVHANKQTKSH